MASRRVASCLFRHLQVQSRSNIRHLRCISQTNVLNPFQKDDCVQLYDLYGNKHNFHSSAIQFQETATQETTTQETTKQEIVNPVAEYEFQAETRMLLDIVARSLYSEKEVFVRELISNASDAIEKARYTALQQESVEISDEESVETTEEESMKISITTDKYAKTLTIQDNGIGMTKEELMNNLGTIARSGSKEFIKQIQDGKSGGDPQSIIGQFGVGFYSAFMVADKVEVFTQSKIPDSPCYHWVSDGAGKYTIDEVKAQEFGTKIICHLKVEDREFSDETVIRDVIKKYSNFVGCPIEVNDERVNTIQPVWLSDPKSVTLEEHSDFYRFIGSSYDNPRFILHYHTDAPINIRTVLYFPEGKPGLFDLNRDGDSGVSLYCRKVLIKSKAENLVPKWLRFVKGVVDSEDVPLNISRELLQDSTVIRRLRTVIQNRVVRYLSERARKDPENYDKFFTDYGIFLKEGIITSTEQMEKEEIAKLIMFQTSLNPAEVKSTLPEYISRMAEDQKDIYYLAAPSRELAEQSPYFESLKKRGIEVLFCYETYDEVVFMQLREFGNKKLTSVEKEMRQDKSEANYSEESGGLQKSEAQSLMDWIKKTLAGRCWGVKTTSRLESHPCVVTVEEMSSARHFVKTQFSQIAEDARYSLLQPQLEINPSHPIIIKMNKLRDQDPELAELLAKQLFNNAMVMAGLVEDPRTVLSSLNELLERALEKH